MNHRQGVCAVCWNIRKVLFSQKASVYQPSSSVFDQQMCINLLFSITSTESPCGSLISTPVTRRCCLHTPHLLLIIQLVLLPTLTDQAGSYLQSGNHSASGVSYNESYLRYFNKNKAINQLQKVLMVPSPFSLHVQKAAALALMDRTCFTCVFKADL